MIDLDTYSIADLLHLYADCQEIKLLASLGIKPSEDPVLGSVHGEQLTAELTLLENHILSILHERAKGVGT